METLQREAEQNGKFLCYLYKASEAEEKRSQIIGCENTLSLEKGREEAALATHEERQAPSEKYIYVCRRRSVCGEEVCIYYTCNHGRKEASSSSTKKGRSLCILDLGALHFLHSCAHLISPLFLREEGRKPLTILLPT